MMNDLVTIIIPAYNVQDYIFRAIESSINQTYKNIEIVIVDDGSNDGTKTVVERYAEKEERIKLFSQKNSGVSSARNHALKVSSGRFVLFLDSDDWLEDNTVEELLKLEKEDYLICVDRYFAYFNDSGEIYRERQRDVKDPEIINLESALLTAGTGNYNLQSSCYKLFNNDVIKKNNLSFREDIHHGEDGLFVFEYLLHTKGIIFSTEPLWDILERPGSATTAPYNHKWLTMINSVECMIQLSKGYEEVQKALYLYKAQRLMILLKAYCKGQNNESSDYQIIKSEIKEVISSKYYRDMPDKMKIKLKIAKSLPFTLERIIYLKK